MSIGVSLYPRDGDDIGELLRHSDTAMYQAKDRGRNNFQVFSPVMDRKLQERVNHGSTPRAALELEAVRRALPTDHRYRNGRVIGLEALVRWKIRSMASFAPATIHLPVAEETGLIEPIGEFVWRHVAQDMVRWRERI